MRITKLIILLVLLSFFTTATAAAFRSVPLKIEVTGEDSATVFFSGWCAIEIGNRTLHKIEFEGEDSNMDPIEVHGRHIDSCEIINKSGKGSITLVLYANGIEIYRNTSKKNDDKIIYGPTMQRYSTKPPVMQ